MSIKMRLIHLMNIRRLMRIRNIVCVIFPICIHAESSWYDQKLEGWYYFEERSADQPQHSQTLSPKEAATLVAREQEYLKELRSLALIDPTRENVESYMKRQKLWIDQSTQFAETWKEVLLSHPLLSASLENPTTTHGILAQKALSQATRKNLINTLSEDHFLLFFFNGDEVFSEKMGEVVALFKEINDWKVEVISLNGKGIPSFPQYKSNDHLKEICQVEATPSLYLVNPFTDTIYPVGAGILSVQQIEENIEYQINRHEAPSHE